MKMRFIYLLLIPVLLAGLFACNSETDENYDLPASVMISGFNLVKNDSVMKNLADVFFTINLVGGQIYNSDSLAPGSRTKALLAKISVPSASRIEILTPKDTTDYSEKDSIDFSDWVKIRVTALNNVATKTYDVKVNVHTQWPDSMQWSRMSVASFPLDDALMAQKTVSESGRLYSILQMRQSYSFYDALQPNVVVPSQITFDADIHSLQLMDGRFYMLDRTGVMYASSDGMAWNATTETGWQSLIGVYNAGKKVILGVVKKADNSFVHATFDGTQRTEGRAIDPEFPITGYSNVADFITGTPLAPQVAVAGGKLQNGKLTNAVWAYDGSNWAWLNQDIPGSFSAREGAMFFSYNTAQDQVYKVWFLIGGKNDSGYLKDVYTSVNSGIEWKAAGSMLQLPASVNARAYASVFVIKGSPFPANANRSMWNDLSPVKMKSACRSVSLLAGLSEDQIPFVYMFGGELSSGATYNQIWRAVVNQLTFEPIE